MPKARCRAGVVSPGAGQRSAELAPSNLWLAREGRLPALVVREGGHRMNAISLHSYFSLTGANVARGVRALPLL